MTEARLLVVEDDANIVELLTASLRYAGFDVETVRDGESALTAAREFRPDLVVLDVMLPGMDGFDVARRLATEGRPPVLFLTARDATADKVTGLILGGDDYVTKPFSLDEVIARIRAVQRRTGAGSAASPARLSFADIELNDETHEVWKAGTLVELSPTEFKLLRYFLANAGRVVSKAQILDHVWRYDFGREANVVESYVSYLRRKIDMSEPRLLHTLRGVGYVLRLPGREGHRRPGSPALRAHPLAGAAGGRTPAGRGGRAGRRRRGGDHDDALVPGRPGGQPAAGGGPAPDRAERHVERSRRSGRGRPAAQRVRAGGAERGRRDRLRPDQRPGRRARAASPAADRHRPRGRHHPVVRGHGRRGRRRRAVAGRGPGDDPVRRLARHPCWSRRASATSRAPSTASPCSSR